MTESFATPGHGRSNCDDCAAVAEDVHLCGCYSAQARDGGRLMGEGHLNRSAVFAAAVRLDFQRQPCPKCGRGHLESFRGIQSFVAANDLDKLRELFLFKLWNYL